MSSCDLPLVCSMEGGELFDRIQKKGHFTERGTLMLEGREEVRGRNTCTELLCVFITSLLHVLFIIMSPGNTKLRSMCKSDNLQLRWFQTFPMCVFTSL